MKFLKVILLVSAFFSLYACVMADSASKDLGTNENAMAPRVYYAGVEGLKLFPESSFSGAPLAELPLHQKVLRYKLERGFAYVKVPGTGQVGWVRNRDLVWRIPKTSQKTSKSVSPSAKEQVEIPPGKTPSVNHDPNQETDRKRDASMFDAM